MRPHKAQVSQRFYETLLSRKQRARRKSIVIWAAVDAELQSSYRNNTEPDLYGAAYQAYELSLRGGEQLLEPGKKKKARFHSGLQKLKEHAKEWTGFAWDDVNWGLAISWKAGSLSFQLEERSKMIPVPDAEKTVRSFYDHLNARQFEAAWNLLEPAYQLRRWEANPIRFIEGYKTFAAIHGFQPFLRSSEQHFAVFDVFYEEQQRIPFIAEIEDISHMSIGEAKRNLPELLASLEAVFVSLGAKQEKFESLRFSRLFHADAAIALPWEMGIAMEVMDRQFPEAETRILSRGRRITLIKETGNWLIRSIAWLSV